MAKTNEEYQQELAQAFVRAGEKQFMIRAYKDMLTKEANELNTLNQKIEALQKSYRTFLSTNVPSIAPKEAVEAVKEQDAVVPTESA
jgi:hypothetical protein